MALPNIIYQGPTNFAQFAFNGTLAVTVGDFMYYVTDDVRPLTSLTTGASEAADQLTISKVFAGVAKDARTTSETGALTAFPIMTDLVAEYDCVSATFEIGDLVGVSWNGGSALANQVVTKVTAANLAIGYATKRYASATTRVQCRILSAVVPHAVGGIGFPAYTTTGTTTGFTAGSGTASKSDSTFTGDLASAAYTVGDVVRALKIAGIMAQ